MHEPSANNLVTLSSALNYSGGGRKRSVKRPLLIFIKKGFGEYNRYQRLFMRGFHIQSSLSPLWPRPSAEDEPVGLRELKHPTAREKSPEGEVVVKATSKGGAKKGNKQFYRRAEQKCCESEKWLMETVPFLIIHTAIIQHIARTI